MKHKLSVPQDETETIINYSKLIGEWAELYTTDKNIMKRYEKFMSKYPDDCKLVKEDQYSMTFSVPAKLVGIYPRSPRRLTEEQKIQRAERMKNILRNR